MEIRTLIDAYFDVNILLALSFGFWFIAQRLLVWLGLSRAYTTQLRLLNAVFLATLISPLLVVVLGVIPVTAQFFTAYSVNITDIITAQYLHGNFQMTPSDFEQALGFRGRVISQIQSLDVGFGLAILGFIATGFLVASFRLAIGFRRLCTTVSDATLWRQIGRFELRVSDTVSIPFSTRCLRRRIIVIPSSILSNPTDLRVALSHEFQHFRQRDLEWEIGLELLKPFFFWNPAYTLWKRKFEALRELSCDQNVMARKTINVGEYCRSLLNICEKGLTPGKLFIARVPSVALVEKRQMLLGKSSAKLLDQRLESLLKGNPERHPRALFAFFFIPLFTITLIGSMAIQKPDGWSYDRLMLSTIVNLERLAARNEIASAQFGKN